MWPTSCARTDSSSSSSISAASSVIATTFLHSKSKVSEWGTAEEEEPNADSSIPLVSWIRIFFIELNILLTRAVSRSSDSIPSIFFRETFEIAWKRSRLARLRRNAIERGLARNEKPRASSDTREMAPEPDLRYRFTSIAQNARLASTKVQTETESTITESNRKDLVLESLLNL